jgi:hypothetical protein
MCLRQYSWSQVDPKQFLVCRCCFFLIFACFSANNVF